MMFPVGSLLVCKNDNRGLLLYDECPFDNSAANYEWVDEKGSWIVIKEYSKEKSFQKHSWFKIVGPWGIVGWTNAKHIFKLHFIDEMI